ncbi:MAG: hypothetical protein HGA97_12670 [Chlorobiaceae bacterium]|nr:hypothetical protein [Chlorobiaceae bacterium]
MLEIHEALARNQCKSRYCRWSPRRELFRISAENRLIDEINLWMEFHKARNLTAHTYHAGIAEQAFQGAIMLPEQGSLLIERLRKGND